MPQTKISMVIIDDNREFCNIVKDYLSAEEDIIVSGMAHDGISGLKLIEQVKPNLVILDIIMPHLDGLGVLEKLPTMNLSTLPRVIILSAVGQEQITQRAIALGADYYLVKPFDMLTLVDRIRQTVGGEDKWIEAKTINSVSKRDSSTVFANKSNDLEQQVTDIIRKVGIPAHINGYKFIREAITMAVNDMEILSAVTKQLYPAIAEKYNTTASRVERSIRHAIELAWNRGQVDLLNEIFGHTISDFRGKPTNSEFIALISDRIRLSNKAS
jgi:sporulation transcription factor Spo0A